MIRTVTATTDNYCGNDKAVSYSFEVPDMDFDLIGAIYAASAEYLMTPEGVEDYYDNDCEWNLKTFVECIPDSICTEYGFCIAAMPDNAVHVDFDEQLYDDGKFPFDCTEPSPVTSYLHYLTSGKAGTDELSEFIGEKPKFGHVKEQVLNAYMEMDDEDLKALADEWYDEQI